MISRDYTYIEIKIAFARCTCFNEVLRASVAVMSCIYAGSSHDPMSVSDIALNRNKQLENGNSNR